MKHKLTASLLALMLVAVQSHATTLSAATRGKANTFFDAKPHILPLTDGGAKSISFTTSTPNQQVVISYSAECAVGGSDNITYVDLDILVDGVAAPPSDSDNAFCTDRGNGIRANWASVITTVVAQVPSAGTHTVQVRGTLQHFEEGDEWSVDDSATVVTN
jgi:hypothetical protein